MGGATVHWLLQEAREVPAGEDWLTPAELAKRDSLYVPKRRADWLLGRWTAKVAVSLYLDARHVAPSRIEIAAGDGGAPRAWIDGAPAPVALSLSHAGGAALCAVAECGVLIGCDLEVIAPRARAFAADYFTAEEIALVRAAPTSAADALETLVWSAKEGALKAVGEGLRRDTRSAVVRVAEGLPGLLDRNAPSAWAPLVVDCLETGRRFHGWWSANGERVLTLVAAPPPDLPRQLDPKGVELSHAPWRDG